MQSGQQNCVIFGGAFSAGPERCAVRALIGQGVRIRQSADQIYPGPARPLPTLESRIEERSRNAEITREMATIEIEQPKHLLPILAEFLTA
jgi:hypothetical protein